LTDVKFQVLQSPKTVPRRKSSIGLFRFGLVWFAGWLVGWFGLVGWLVGWMDGWVGGWVVD